MIGLQAHQVGVRVVAHPIERLEGPAVANGDQADGRGLGDIGRADQEGRLVSLEDPLHQAGRDAGEDAALDQELGQLGALGIDADN